jgi:hypothetical protein
MSSAVHEKRNDRYVIHPDVMTLEERTMACKLDVMFLDELFSKKSGANDISTILNGVTPMVWRPVMADPKNKGTQHKPFLWISTANHEITDHVYNVTALLRRVHVRFIVEGGKFYDQRCFEIQEPSGTFLGGFKICNRTFGRWKRTKVTRSVTKVRDPATGNERDQETESKSSETYEEVVDSSVQNSFLCEHCVPMKYEHVILTIMRNTAHKLSLSVEARRIFRERIQEAF